MPLMVQLELTNRVDPSEPRDLGGQSSHVADAFEDLISASGRDSASTVDQGDREVREVCPGPPSSRTWYVL